MNRVTAFVLLVASLLLAACSNNRSNVYQGWIEADLIFISPEETGRVETLSVRQGDRVAEKAPLFTLDDELQRAEVAEREASLVNAKSAYGRAIALLKSNAGTQKSLEDAEAAMRSSQARLNSAQTKLARRKVFSPAEGSVQQIYFRVGEIVPAGRPVLSLLPPGNMKVRFFVSEAVLPTLAVSDVVNIQCDGCDGDLKAKISFIARSAEYTPPVIYSQEERNKLVFLIEARPDQPERLRVGQPVSVTLAARDGPR